MDKNLISLIKISNKILKNVHILIFIIIIYVSVLILGKLNLITFFITFFKILSPLFIGVIIAWLLRPLINYLENNGVKRIIALIIVYLLIVFIFYIVIVNFVPIFLNEFSEFMKVFPKTLNDFVSDINLNFLNISIIKNEAYSVINSFVIDAGKDIPITFMNLIKGISSFLIGFIIGFYLLISNNAITINANLKKDTFDLIFRINNSLRGYVKGTILSSFIVFILSTIIFYLLGLDSALFFGFICGITNIIPIIGPYIGAVIPVIVAFTRGTTYGVLVTILLFVIQTIEGNVIQPIIMSKSVKIHPITSIVSLLVFGYFLGIVGMVFAVPLVVIIKEVYFYLNKKYNNYKKI